jgi:hypothetical protein
VTITLTSSAGSCSLSKAEVITGLAKDSYDDFGKAENVSIKTLADTSYQACGKKVRVTLPSKSIVHHLLLRCYHDDANRAPEKEADHAKQSQAPGKVFAGHGWGTGRRGVA